MTPSWLTVVSRAVVLGIVLWLAACGGGTAQSVADAAPGSDAGVADGATNVDAGPEYLLAADYCESIVGFFCEFYLRCGRMVAADLAVCREQFLEGCVGRWEPRYEALETAGLVRLRSAGIAACQAHLATVSCERQVRELAGPCGQMWEGTQPAGGPCGLDVESFVCAPGNECVLSLDLCGTCEALVAPGGSCVEPEVTCGVEAECQEGTCVARVGVGDACSDTVPCEVGATCTEGVCVGRTVVGLGDDCDAWHRCPYFSRCVEGTCQATFGLGGSCSTHNDCETGFCGSTRTCVALLPAGAPCGYSPECSTGTCVSGFCLTFPGPCFD